MKKLVSVLVLLVLVISFVAGIMLTEAKAIPPDTIECIDGKLWLCTWDIRNGVLRYHCHWAGPC